MNTNKIKEIKKKLKLSKRQKSILIGKLLGDGHLETQNNGRTYRLKIEHSIQQSDYVNWLYEEFKDWVRQKPYIKVRKNGQKSIGFNTYSSGSFRFYGQLFYKKKKKVVPKMLCKELQPIGLAIWFMDDGSRKSLKHKTYILHTLGFTKKDVLLLKTSLKNNFNIDANLHFQRNKYFRLYIMSGSAKRFTEIIYPFVKEIVSMKHKIVSDWITKMPKK